jgi:hypothetical protein
VQPQHPYLLNSASQPNQFISLHTQNITPLWGGSLDSLPWRQSSGGRASAAERWRQSSGGRAAAEEQRRQSGGGRARVGFFVIFLERYKKITMVFWLFSLERYRKYNSRQVTFLPHRAALAVLMSYPPAAAAATPQEFWLFFHCVDVRGATDQAAKHARRCCFAMLDFFGLNSVFMSTTPDDKCSFRVRLYFKPHYWVSSGGIFQNGIIRLFCNLESTEY